MKKVVLPILIICSLLVWISCEKDETVINNGGSNPPVLGKMLPFKIHLTDTPGQFDEVNVEILQFSAKLDSGGWQNLNTIAGVYDLLQFQNGIDTTIVNDSLAAGTGIKELRMLLGTNNYVVIGSATTSMSTPSGQSSGIKIKFDTVISADSLNDVTIDFDACKSVKELGNGQYQLHPVIKVL